MTDTENAEYSSQKGSPGEQLARARKQRQISLIDAARELKLPRTTLENIEADRFDRIATIYRRGYILNYARLVGLDPQPLLDAAGNSEPEPLRAVLPMRARPRRFDHFLKFATYALVTTMIVPPLVYFFVLGGARLFESDLVARQADPDGAVAVEETRPGYRERFAEALAVQSLDSARLDESHLSASALPMNPIRSAAPVETIPETAASDAGGEDTGASEPVSRLELVLSDDSWIEIESADGQRLEFDLLRSGDTRQYSGQAPFKLLLGRAGAVDLVLNGEPVLFEGHDQAGVVELVIGSNPPIRAPEASTGGGLAE